MGINYKPLLASLEKLNLELLELREKINLSNMTVYKLKNGEPVTFEVLDRICEALGLRVDEVIEHDGLPFQKSKPRIAQIEKRKNK